MKKYMLNAVLALLFGAVASEAAVVYQTGFTGDTLIDQSVSGVENINGIYNGEWVGVPASASIGDSAFLKSNQQASRAMFYIIPGSSISAGTGTLSFDVLDIWNKGSLNVMVWNVDNGSGITGDCIEFDFFGGARATFATNTVGPIANGSATIDTMGASELIIGGLDNNDVASVVKNHSITFTYDGTGDIVLGFNTFARVDVNKLATFDNVVVDGLTISNNDPVFSPSTFSTGDAAEGSPYNDTIAGFASDADGDTLTYSKAGGPDWLIVASDGTLSGTPQASDSGPNSFTVKVEDAFGFDTATLNITVVSIPTAPVFSMDMIYKSSAFVGTAYTNSIAFTAADYEYDPLTYSKVGGSPSWLTIEADGTVHGTPTSGDLGENLVTVQVDAVDGSDTTTMSIHVLPEPAAYGRPNILYILCDDLGYADISIMGWSNLEYETPNIDSIFNSGARFKAGFVSNSVCSPSRAGLLTGRFGGRFGYDGNLNHTKAQLPGSLVGLPTNQVTIADVLRDGAGYKTIGLGKWHLGDNNDLFHPNLRGFDEYYGMIGGSRSYFQTTTESLTGSVYSNDVWVAEPADMYLTDFLTDAALNYMTDQTVNAPDQPWFMYMSYTAPHHPMHAQKEVMDRIPRGSSSAYAAGEWITIKDSNLVENKYKSYDNSELRHVYAAMVLSMDDNVGRLLNKLGELGIADNTLVVFHSDNGGPTDQNWSKNNPLRGKKGELWEGGIRVPFAFSWPGVIPSGQVFENDNEVCSVDLMPTFAAISTADQAVEFKTDGVNLMPLLRKRVPSLPPRDLFWRRNGEAHIAVRSGVWKCYENRSQPAVYLFDHSSGTGENSGNKAGSNPTKLAEMQDTLNAYNDIFPDGLIGIGGSNISIMPYDLKDAVAGSPYSWQLTLQSETADPVVWSMTGNPSWLSINPSTGLLSGTPQATDPKDNWVSLQITQNATSSTFNWKAPLTVVGGYDPNDTDGDGLLDSWESAQFGSLTTSAGGVTDSDGDGVTDVEEYVAGTDPNNVDDYFTTPFAVTGTTFSITIDGKAGKEYILHTTTDLAADEWVYGDSVSLQADGETTLETRVPEGSTALFGRVRVKAD